MNEPITIHETRETITEARLKAALACVECRIKCHRAREVSLREAGSHFRETELGRALARCDKACSAAADSCLTRFVAPGKTWEAFAEACEECGSLCQRLGGPLLDETATACEDAAKACRRLREVLLAAGGRNGAPPSGPSPFEGNEARTEGSEEIDRSWVGG